MKNQYFGDINDYRKYGLLRCLAETGLRLGVCWMLTAPDARRDGKKTAYLEQPRKWRHRDPPLFDFLKRTVDADKRDVRHLEESGLLPEAMFYSDLLRDDGQSRIKYFRNALAALHSTDVLFFDPDNGLEVPSVPYGRVGSGRYVYWPEIETAGQAGASLVVFQHWKRENRTDTANRLSSELEERLPEQISVVQVHTKFVLFLIAQNKHHQDHFKRAFGCLADRWGGDMVVKSYSAS